jgi:hypothetical protein
MARARAGAVSLRRGWHRRPRRPWYLSPEGFRDLRLGCLLSRKACADLLGCSVRTVRAWDAGARRVPWAAVKLLRLYRLGDLGTLAPTWHGWTLRRDGLVSPEGYTYRLADLGWWSLTCRQAECWRQGRERQRQRGGGAAVPEPLSASGTAQAPVGELPAPVTDRPSPSPLTASPAVVVDAVEGVDVRRVPKAARVSEPPQVRGLSSTQQVVRKRGKTRRGKACSGGPLGPFPAPRQGERTLHHRPPAGSRQREGGAGRA